MEMEKQGFETLVTGKNNKAAYEAAIAAASSPGSVYNPLYIYGGIGTGKTHIMRAIKATIEKSDLGGRILHYSAGDFTIELVSAIRRKAMSGFREKYESAEVFLLDDVEQLSFKEASQECLLAIFDKLYDKGKQIVISSDRHPRKIEGMNERLLARMSSGMVVEIDPFDPETIKGVLMNFLGDEKMLPDEIVAFIAENFDLNAWELKGIVTALSGYAKSCGGTVTGEMARRFLMNYSERETPLCQTTKSNI